MREDLRAPGRVEEANALAVWAASAADARAHDDRIMICRPIEWLVSGSGFAAGSFVYYAVATDNASEVAYTGFLYRMRADIADRYVEIAEKNGVDLTDPLETRSIGRLVNSLTGRGDLGSLEKVGKQVNTIFFSPKMVKSQFDFLTVQVMTWLSPFRNFAQSASVGNP